MCMGVLSTCTSVHHLYAWSPQRAEEGTRCPGTGGPHSWGPPSECRKSSPGPLEEQAVHLTSEPSLSSPRGAVTLWLSIIYAKMNSRVMCELKDDQFHLELGTAEKCQSQKGSLFLNVNKGNSKNIFLKSKMGLSMTKLRANIKPWQEINITETFLIRGDGIQLGMKNKVQLYFLEFSANKCFEK